MSLEESDIIDPIRSRLETRVNIMRTYISCLPAECSNSNLTAKQRLIPQRPESARDSSLPKRQTGAEVAGV